MTTPFLQPEFFHVHVQRINDTDDGDILTPEQYAEFRDNNEAARAYGVDPADVETLFGWTWRLSAPGYLDSTDWSGVVDTLPEAITELRGMFDDSELLPYLCDELPGFSEFWKGYLISLAFTAMDMGSECGGGVLEPWSNPGGDISEVVDPDDVAAILDELERLDECRSDCLDFLCQAYHLIPEDKYELAGCDFHFTRNGHGTGFWDRDWNSGDVLTELSKPYGTAELCWRPKADTDAPSWDLAAYEFDITN